MKRFSLLGVLMVVVFALAAVVVAPAAFALPELLPIKTGGTHYTAASDGTEEVTLEINANEKVNCKAATGEGGQETDTLGTFRISFTSCKETILGTACSTSGDASGVILTNGSFHYVIDTLGATLGANGVAILFLPEITNFECDGGLTKFKVTGRVLCLLLEPLVSRSTHLFHCVQTAGKQNVTSYYNATGTLITGVILETSKNGGALAQSGELALASVNFPEAVAIMNE
jgi:hypothetical protein